MIPIAGLVVSIVDPKPGENIIDCCAAPGGKTLFMASRLRGQGKPLALTKERIVQTGIRKIIFLFFKKIFITACMLLWVNKMKFSFVNVIFLPLKRKFPKRNISSTSHFVGLSNLSNN